MFLFKHFCICMLYQGFKNDNENVMSVFIEYLGCYECQQLAVYWGQDPAGGMRLMLEKRLDYYCMNYEYDIIPVAFLDIFFDLNNKGKSLRSVNN